MPALPVILGVVFIILKLCGVIAWSWFWVLSPFWIMLLIGLFALILFGLGFLNFARKAEKMHEEIRATGFDRRRDLW